MTSMRTLSADEYASETGIDPTFIAGLIAGGILRPDDGRFQGADILRLETVREGGRPDRCRR